MLIGKIPTPCRPGNVRIPVPGSPVKNSSRRKGQQRALGRESRATALPPNYACPRLADFFLDRPGMPLRREENHGLNNNKGMRHSATGNRR